MDISHRDLTLFLAVVDEKSFTKAATKCGLSQSALSSRIRQIEEGLGATLFDRTTRSVELTSEGQLLEVSARRLSEEFTEVVTNFREHAACRRGRVRIAASPSLCTAWLPGIFAQFMVRFPGIELVLHDKMSQGCLELLRAGQVDLALTSEHGGGTDLHSTVIGLDRFYLVCPKGHPLLTKAKLTPEDLASYSYVLVSRDSSIRQHIDAAFHPVALNAKLEVNHTATIAGMVEAGIGITIMPALSLWQFRRPGLETRLLPFKNIARPLHLIKRQGYVLSPAARAFYEQTLLEKGKLEILAEKQGPIVHFGTERQTSDYPEYDAAK